MTTILHVIQRAFWPIQTMAVLLTLMSLSGCMSLPMPTKFNKDDLKQTLREVRTQIDQNQPDAAISLLREAKKKFTDGEQLENGQGVLFQFEAQMLATIGHLEFNRGSIADAVGYWRDSFDVEINGWQAQNEIQKKNAVVIDIIGSVLIGAATGAASRSSRSSSKTGTSTYFYTVPNTSWPTPEMLRVGSPKDTVLRFPVRVELAPFSNIVKLRAGDKNCTATMVAPRVAISAAHCMPQDSAPPNAVHITLQRKSIFPSKEMRIVRHFTHQGENASWDGKKENDWVILIAESGYDTQGPFWGTTYQTVARPNSAIASGIEKVMLAGYSSDLNEGAYLTLHYGCRIKPGQNLKSGIYLTNCEDAAGSSGAAVMSTTPPFDIVGIHTAKIREPKDEFASVEIFSDQFIATLNNILGTRPTITRPIAVAPAAAKNDGSAYVTPQAPSPSPLPATVEKKVQEAGVPKSAAPPSSAVEEKLKLLTNLRNRQLITEEDFQLKRKEVLQGL
jgi:hypothetical protein